MTNDPELIGPEKAQKLVDNRHPESRPPIPDSRGTQVLIGLMKSGQWKSLKDGVENRICIDEEGRLVDGVQRMVAVIEADVEIEFLVCRGIEMGAVWDEYARH